MEHQNLKLKVCGLRDTENIKDIIDVKPDYMGFIFYKPSPRYVGDSFSLELMNTIPLTIKKVGVFVNEDIENLINIAGKYRLDMVQLHGDEPPGYCKKLEGKGFRIIKAVRIFSKKDLKLVSTYKNYIDYALLDRGGVNFGGNGLKFNWELLDHYESDIPFFLSGGIRLDDVPKIASIKHNNLHAIDVNSGFETAPGHKDVSKLTTLKNEIIC